MFTTGPDAIDDTAAEHRRRETELVAQNRDAIPVTTADVDETSAPYLVADLIEDDMVISVAEQRVLVHEPSGTTFDSPTQLSVFNRGWTAACDADEADK